MSTSSAKRGTKRRKITPHFDPSAERLLDVLTRCVERFETDLAKSLKETDIRNACRDIHRLLLVTMADRFGIDIDAAMQFRINV
jgi:hypothetical protein